MTHIAPAAEAEADDDAADFNFGYSSSAGSAAVAVKDEPGVVHIASRTVIYTPLIKF